MASFVVRLGLDTPLLQGGAGAGAPDSAHLLRGPAVRGLLHAFTRALIGPFYGGDPEKTREAERLLLGATGDDKSPPTFRVADISDHRMEPDRETFRICLRPGQHRARKGYDWFEFNRRWVRFQIRPRAAEHDPLLPEALWAVAWTAFTLGAIGLRSRRGYGSLTVLEAQGQSPDLPTFPDPPEVAELEAGLRTGLGTVFETIESWLISREALSKGLTKGPHLAGRRDAFFQLASSQQVFVGKREVERGGKPPDYAAMERLMTLCHKEKARSPREYERSMGYGGQGKRRMSSPFWVRMYRVKGGVVPVITYSQRNRSEAPHNVLEGLGACALDGDSI